MHSHPVALDQCRRLMASLPHVSGVTSPYAAGGRQAISSDGRIAFATVTFDEQAPALSKAQVERVISAAQTARAPNLQVELGGQAIAKGDPLLVVLAAAACATR